MSHIAVLKRTSHSLVLLSIFSQSWHMRSKAVQVGMSLNNSPTHCSVHSRVHQIQHIRHWHCLCENVDPANVFFFCQALNISLFADQDYITYGKKENWGLLRNHFSKHQQTGDSNSRRPSTFESQDISINCTSARLKCNFNIRA